MMRWLALVGALGACRFNFDELSDAGTDSANAPKRVFYGKASNTTLGARLGDAVAISQDGNTIAVGALQEGSIGGAQSGAVYIFVRAGDSWREQAFLKAANAEGDDQFGRAIALSADGNTLAVGANGEDSAAVGVNGDATSNAAADSGAVYVLTRVGEAWSQQAYIKASNTDPADDFGAAVALSANGNVLAVGAMGEASSGQGVGANQTMNNAPNAGAVYVFTRAGTTWTQQEYIKSSNADPTDRFGEELALSGDGTTLAVGAPLEDSNGDPTDNSLSEAGAVYVFVFAGTWTQQAYVKASVLDLSDTTGAYDQFGWGVVLSGDGNILGVGARVEASGTGDPTDNSARGAGAAYVFTRVATVWTQQAYLKAPAPGPSELFGDVIDLSTSGDVLVGGAPNAALSQGEVHAFRNNGYDLTLTAPNASEMDLFGPVAIAGNGATIVVGAPGEDSNATGIDGDSSDNSALAAGAFYIFE